MQNLLRAVLVTGGVALALGGCGDAASDTTGLRGNIILIDTPDNGMTSVTLFAAGGNEAQAQTTTDATGAFKFARLPAGTYRLHAEHQGYAALERDGILVSDSQHGEQNLGDLILTRIFISGNGGTVTGGGSSPDGKKDLFRVDDTLEVYDQDTGKLTPLPTDFPFAGGLFTTDDQFLLAKVPSTAAPVDDTSLPPDLSMGGNSTPPPSSGGQFALYVLPLAGGAPWAVSYSVLTAGMGDNGQIGFVLVPASSGLAGNVDLYTFTITATASAPKLVGSELAIADLRLLRSSTYGNDNLGIYTKILYPHDPAATPFGDAYDWSVLDLSTGASTLLVSAVHQVEVHDATDPHKSIYLFTHTGGMVDSETYDLYTYLLGDTTANKLGTFDSPSTNPMISDPTVSTTPPGFWLMDQKTSTPTTEVALISSSDGKPTSLGRFNGSIFGGDWSGSSTIAEDGKHTWALRMNGAVGELVSIDLTTGTATVVQSGLTVPGGGAVDASSSLANVSFTLRDPLGFNRLVVDTNANGTTLTQVLVDANGAHSLGTTPVAVWGRVTLSQDGKLVAFADAANGIGYGAVPASGDVTIARVPGSNVAGVLARAGLDGLTVAWTKPNVSLTTDYHSFAVAGATDTLIATAVGFNALDVIGTSKLLSVYGAGNASQVVKVAAAQTPLTGPTYNAGLSGQKIAASADGQRIVVLDQGAQAVQLANGTPPTIAFVPNATSLYTFPSATRFLLSSFGNMAIVDQDGTTTMRSGNFFELAPEPSAFSLGRSPDGERLFFRDGFGQDVVSIGSTGAAIATGLAIYDDSQFRLRRVGGSMVASGFDVDTNATTLLSIDRTTGAVTTLTETVQGGGSFAPSPFPGAQPWPSADGKTFYYFDRKPADTVAMTPSVLRLWAYDGNAAPVLLGERVALNPPPAIRADGALEIRTTVDSLTGTASVVVVPPGTTTPAVVASGVRSAQASPDGASRAAVLLDGGALSLASGPLDGPLATMGAVQFFDLSGNLAWGTQRLFVIDRAVTSTDGGTLYTGAIGQAGLTKISRNVLGVFPDASGHQAAVVSLDATGKGLLIGRFSTTTL